MRLGVLGLTLATLAGAAELPADLRGDAGSPTVAWRLAGVPPGATVVGVPRDDGDDLLVGGARANSEPGRLGDLCLVSTRGWAKRLLRCGSGVRGLPAMLREVVLAAAGDNAVWVWPLGQGGSEGSPPRVDARRVLYCGPVVVGSTFLFAAGRMVFSVSDLIEPRWQVEVGAPVRTPLASDGRLVFVATGNGLTALDAQTGDTHWSASLPSAPQTGLLATAGLVVVGTMDGHLRAFDAAGGTPAWARAVAHAALSTHLALAGPWLFATTDDGTLVAVMAETGEPVWQGKRPGPLSSPTIAFGHVFVTGGDGQLHAVPLAPDRPGWSWAPAAEGVVERLVGTPCVFAHRVYVTTDDGVLLALDLPAAEGPAPWPVPGGTAHRNGRVVPPEEDE